MLIRIVKMTFEPEKANDFLKTFNERKGQIISFKGCEGVELLRNTSDPNIFFTYSSWHDEDSLNNYRNSELFIEVWNTVRKWFSDKPQAWSVEKMG